jgi:glycine/D-amino acid oxidase-like deaminating enzyme
MKNAVGTITHSAGAFWPYRLMTSLFARMLEKHRGGFSIETNTPVSSISYDNTKNAQYPYTLVTPRGTIRAKTVIHCTNGWAGHLIPNLRGKIFSLRGTMSTQAAGPNLPHVGDRTSWSTFDRPQYDPADGSFTSNFYYITQNAKTGDVFVGGEKSRPEDLLTSDDTKISPWSEKNLRTILPKIFRKGWEESEVPLVRQIWSGVMGFTLDHMPIVGQLPASVTGRDGGGEWIAAGYNGMGMPLCWGCGEAVAKMVLGRDKEVHQWLPSSFLAKNERLENPRVSIEDAIERFFGGGPAS